MLKTPDSVPPRAEDTRVVDRGGGGTGFPFLKPPTDPSEIGWLAHYRVLALLGEGGMGSVFQAEDTQLQRTVALKVMKPEMARDSDCRVRFLREARAMAALKSDHVVTIYQVGQDNDVPYLAMEFLEGETLDQWLERGIRPAPAQLLDLAQQLTLGLAAAHERGLVHRDIKPANIWLEAGPEIAGSSALRAAAPPLGRVKLLDFGLARPMQEDTRLTQSGLIVGTPSYMSPEQGRGEVVDSRSDLFSLGVVLYRLCTGTLPFSGATTMALLTSLAVDQPPPVSECNADVPPALADLVMQLLAKKPEERPPSARELLKRLKAIARDLPGSAVVPEEVPLAIPVPAEPDAPSRTTVTPSAPKVAAGAARQRSIRAAVITGAVLLVVACLAAWAFRGASPVASHAERGMQASPAVASSPRATARPPEPPPKLVPAPPVVPGPAARDRTVRSVAWDPKGRWLACVLGLPPESIILVFDTRDWSCARCLSVPQASAVCWSPDGTRLAGSGGNGLLQTWTADGTPVTAFKHPPNSVNVVAWSPDGKRIVSGDSDGTLRLWSPDGTAGRILPAHTQPLRSLAWSPDGKMFASAGLDMTVRLWNADGTASHVFSLKYSIMALAWEPSGTRLGAVLGNNTLQILGTDGKVGGTFTYGKNLGLAIAWSPNDKRLAIADNEGQVHLLTAFGAPEQDLNADGLLISVAWSPDTKLLAAGSSSGKLHVWSATGARIQTIDAAAAAEKNVPKP